MTLLLYYTILAHIIFSYNHNNSVWYKEHYYMLLQLPIAPPLYLCAMHELKKNPKQQNKEQHQNFTELTQFTTNTIAKRQENKT